VTEGVADFQESGSADGNLGEQVEGIPGVDRGKKRGTKDCKKESSSRGGLHSVFLVSPCATG